MAYEDTDKKIKEFLSDWVATATINFVRAVMNLINQNSLPQSKLANPFPYSFELVKWVLNKPQARPLTGDKAKDEVINILNPGSGEEVLLSVAIDLDYALSALSISQESIPAWKEWCSATDAQEEFMLRNHK